MCFELFSGLAAAGPRIAKDRITDPLRGSEFVIFDSHDVAVVGSGDVSDVMTHASLLVQDGAIDRFSVGLVATVSVSATTCRD